MKLIFNSSMPRSGSELLQCILNQRPDTYASTTSPLLEYVYAAAQNLDTQESLSIPAEDRTKSFLAFAKSGIEGYAKSAVNLESIRKNNWAKNIYCDKSRGWIYYYKFLENIIGEEPKMICMVRNLKEICASMEALHRRNVANGMLQDNEIITTEERLNTWLNTEPIGRATRRIKNALDNKYPIFYAKYENLCEQPEETMRAIEQYLGLEPYKYNFTKIEKTSPEDDSAFGYTDIHSVKPSLEKPAQRSEEILHPNTCQAIHESNIWYQNSFDYT